MSSNTIVGGGIRDVGRAIDPTTGRGLANLATGGMYELNSQALGGGGKGQSAPTPPDFYGAANEQTRANRPNQEGPFGSTTWTQDANGNWTQNVSLTPGLNDASQNLIGSINANSGQTPGQMRDAATEAAYQQATSRLDPQWAQREEANRTALLNQGFTADDQGYRNQTENLGRERNDAYAQALFNAQTGAGNAAFAQGMAANMQPYQQLGALQQLSRPGGFMPGADLVGALGAQYGGQLTQYATDQAGKNSMMSGLAGMAPLAFL